MTSAVEAIVPAILVGLIVLAPALSCWLARQRGRSWLEGLLLGVLLGWIGVVVVACLPAKEPAPSRAPGAAEV
jgi:hypothetical protein